MTALNSVPYLAEHPGRSSRLVAAEVSLGYGDRTVVDALSVAIPDAAVTVIVGANACGKSTLLRGMARLLKPTAGAVLLDEPTTFLDVSHQIEVLDLLRDLNASRGTTVVMVLHDLNLAARYADHLVALTRGRVVAAGPPGDVVTEELVRDVFGLDSLVVEDPVSGTPLVVPIGRHTRLATGAGR